MIRQYGEAYDEKQQAMVITDEDKIYDLLNEGIPALQAIGEVYISDTLKGMQIHPSPKVSVGVSIDSGLMKLQLTAGEMSKEELIDILSRYNRKKKVLSPEGRKLCSEGRPWTGCSGRYAGDTAADGPAADGGNDSGGYLPGTVHRWTAAG